MGGRPRRAGRSASFADVDAGPLYITGTTVAEANDKRTLLGSSTTAARMPAVATTLYTSTSTGADTAETDLQSYTLPANVLGTKWPRYPHPRLGRHRGKRQYRTIRLQVRRDHRRLNNTTPAPMASVGSPRPTSSRIGSGQQTCSPFMLMGTTPQDAISTAIWITDTASIIIKVTGQNRTASAGDITRCGMTVEVL